MDASLFPSSLPTDEDSAKQRLHLREFRFNPEEARLASTTGRVEPHRYLKTSQAPRSRAQLLAPVKGATPVSLRVDAHGMPPFDPLPQRVSVGVLEGVNPASTKATPQKPAKKATTRGGSHVRRVSPLRGTTSHTRFPRRATSLDQGGGRGLQIEGNSVLTTSPALALHALEQLSECVQEERRLKAQLESAQQAKVAAFRAVIKVFLAACADGSPASSLGGPDAMTVARCSVISNALVVIIQSYLRGVHSILKTRALCSAARPPSRVAQTVPPLHAFHRHSMSEADRQADSAFERSISTTRTLEDLLDMTEINQLKQLYFDFYDCEVVSLGSEADSEFDGEGAQGGRQADIVASSTATEEEEGEI